MNKSVDMVIKLETQVNELVIILMNMSWEMIAILVIKSQNVIIIQISNLLINAQCLVIKCVTNNVNVSPSS